MRAAFGPDAVEFYPGVYQQAPPDVTGRDVIMVDFSYSREVLFQIASVATSVTLLDHHLTAFKEIGNVPKSVTLTISGGRAAHIDQVDYERLSKHTWSFSGNGHAVTSVQGQLEQLSHMVLPPKAGHEVDHINRNALDNRSVNLRHAEPWQNKANSISGRQQFKGVDSHRNKFVARISIDGEKKHIGSFSTAEEAAHAYDAAARERFGEYARTNFGNRDPFPPNCHFIFDMTRSGAGLAWDYFHPDTRRPEFINYIEDRDLWLKKLPNGDEFTIALRSYPQDFATWDVLIGRGPEALIKQGHAIQRYYRMRVEELKRSAYEARFVELPHRVRIANAPLFAASEVAGELATSDVDFGAIYFEVSPGRWQYSLRSRDGFDVSAVAKLYGGGGHKAAAGFTTDQRIHTAMK